MVLQRSACIAQLQRAAMPVHEGTKVVGSAGGAVRSHSLRHAFAHAHAYAGPSPQVLQLIIHHHITVRQAQHAILVHCIQHVLLNLLATHDQLRSCMLLDPACHGMLQ